jgi:hypothetical protein
MWVVNEDDAVIIVRRRLCDLELSVGAIRAVSPLMGPHVVANTNANTVSDGGVARCEADQDKMPSESKVGAVLSILFMLLLSITAPHWLRAADLSGASPRVDGECGPYADEHEQPVVGTMQSNKHNV